MTPTFSCVSCRRTIKGQTGKCPVCSQQRIHFRNSLPICQTNRCGHHVLCPSGGDGCDLHPTKPGKLTSHLLKGGACFADPQLFGPIPIEKPPSIDIAPYISHDSEHSDVELVTFHFNPCGFRRLRETYYEWLPTLGPLANRLKCYELVFDNDEPEIDGSIVLHGTRAKNAVWQKEAITNIALRRCDSDVKYFAWVDHDLVFTNTNWLSDGIAKIDEGFHAVQLFDEIVRLSLERIVETSRRGAASAFSSNKHRSSNPGGAWIADRAFLDRVGGLNIENLFGGGDQTWLDGLVNEPGRHLNDYSPKLAESLRSWIARTGEIASGVDPSHIAGKCYHLWHGSHANRQYATRNQILIDEDFDPATDIRVNDDGLIEWCSDKPRLHNGIRKFFRNRSEDG